MNNPSKYRIIFLDAKTVDLGDLKMDSLRKQGLYQSSENCQEGQAVELAGAADVVITNKVVFGETEFQKLPKLQLICVCATGVNNIDLEAARRHGIAVCNVAGYSTTTVVEHTLMFLLAFAHRLNEHQNSVFSGEWSRSPSFADLNYPFRDLAGKKLGIIGYGTIGRKVGKLAWALGMEVLVAKLPGRKYSASLRRISLRELLRKADFVTLHCALSPSTRQLINREKLSWMKPSSYLLNLARGPIVNEEEVANALRTGKLAGYATDVFGCEPPDFEHPLIASSIRNKVLITPHIAWASQESRQRLIEEIAKNIAAFRQGRKRNRIV